MGTIRNVHLIGIGAIGGVYASLLADLDPGILTIIAGGERGERLRSEGLIMNGARRMFSVRDPREDVGPADLLLVAVKQHHLAQTIADVASSVGERTTILSLLNGITSEEIIGKRYGMEKLLYSFCVGTDATRVGNAIHYTKVGTIVFGEAENRVHSERVEAVRALFERAAIPVSIPQDMMRELWWKFMMNVGINPVSAILRAPYGVFQHVAEARSLVESASREAVKLANAAGIGLADKDIERCFEIFNTLSPGGKTSMFQDIEAGRKTEIEIFAGTVVELSRRYGLSCPVNELLLTMIRALEKSSSMEAS